MTRPGWGSAGPVVPSGALVGESRAGHSELGRLGRPVGVPDQPGLAGQRGEVLAQHAGGVAAEARRDHGEQRDLGRDDALGVPPVAQGGLGREVGVLVREGGALGARVGEDLHVDAIEPGAPLGVPGVG
jgi:hypothetical protein